MFGVINIFVAYKYTTEIWVNFKLYGTLGALIVFAVGQSIYLARYMDQK